MKLLLTGASGLLGAAVARAAAAQGDEVVGVVGRWPDPVPGVARQVALDLAEPAAVVALVQATRPQAILNCAALAEPAACDAAPALAQRVNVDLPAALAAAARAQGARFVHVSSEQVFDGAAPPYAIASPVNPLHRYGRQKVESERAVLAADPGAAVVRAPLMSGNSLGGRRSVHEKFLEAWSAGKTMRLFTDEIRAVCSAESTAAALLELAARPDLAGVLHWTGAEPVSRWEMGRAVCAHFGFPENWIEPVPRAALPEFTATRPRDLTLDLAPLDRVLRVKPERFAAAVARLVLPAWWRGAGRR
ncbi:SDR family oxidoreductase [Oleiharenicola sp. Vm1]|uniref:SDR family oxidoreductase n=1 Tax=Oleiharenicola sp. Vm1 TaxID=3398393 RepID=UPI0039F47ABD